MTEKIREQLMEIRAGGKANMLDYRAVQRLAFEAGFYELVTYIEDHPREYARFIFTGREDG